MSTAANPQSANTEQEETNGTARSEPTASGSRALATTSNQPTELENSQGTTTISNMVVSKIAGLAAREVNGVHDFGVGASRAFGAMHERIPGARSSTSQGVAVEVGQRQAAIDLTVVVEYGASIVEIARAIRRNVIGALEQMTGLEVVEVNINVVDLHLPGDDEEGSTPSGRVE
ncbi:Asp23/Gls24 family envelope stress response protein [Salinifilum ghardaiensis]